VVDVADIDCEWLRSSQYIQNTRSLHGTLEQRTRYLYPRRSKTSKYPNSSSTVKKIKKKNLKSKNITEEEFFTILLLLRSSVNSLELIHC
jgi:hypothetical protein